MLLGIKTRASVLSGSSAEAAAICHTMLVLQEGLGVWTDFNWQKFGFDLMLL